jgi:hypothetical protein
VAERPQGFFVLGHRILNPVHRRLLAVLDLDPIPGIAGAVAAAAAFGNHAFKVELAGLAEHENSVRALRQQLRQPGLALLDRQVTQVVALEPITPQGDHLLLLVAHFKGGLPPPAKRRRSLAFGNGAPSREFPRGALELKSCGLMHLKRTFRSAWVPSTIGTQ